MSELIAEWTEGTAGCVPGHETFPAVTEIVEGLWMGGCLGSRLPDEFGFVLSLFPWGAYQLGEHTDRLQVPLYDGPEIPDALLVEALARIVNQQREYQASEGRKVLVHCQAGLNRSALITARALILEGMAPADAIALLRERRSPYVLCNQVFEAWLRAL